MKPNIILCHYKNDALSRAWDTYFQFEEDVAIVDADLLSIECDAIVAPGNSFGFMDGGLDLAISKKYGWKIQEELQKTIKSSNLREILIGQCETIDLPEKARHILYTPTMRVPTSNLIAKSVNAYLAMKAALIESIKNPDINAVAIPGLCTGTGKMPVDIAAKQMFEAYDEVYNNNFKEFPTYMDARKHHLYLNPIN